MAKLAGALAILGFLCALVGIITAAGAIPQIAEFTALLWMALSGVIFLGCIAAVISSSQYE